MRRTWLPAAGLTIAVCLVLWIDRTGGSPAQAVDLLGSCLIALLAVGVGWILGGRLTRDPHRRGLISLVAGLWGPLFSTFHVASAPYLGSWFHSPLPAGATWTAVCGVAIWLLSRGTASFAFTTRVLGIAAVVLVATQSVRVVQPLLRAETLEPVPDHRDGRRPDVYLIVLDKYSSGAWLSHTYGLDHTGFEDSLRALGFVVPGAARANYAHTELALASFLNWRLFDAPEDDQPRLTWSGMRDLIGTARTWDVFRENGYRVVTLPTTFSATRALANADLHLSPPSRRGAPFGETWRVNSPLASWSPLRCVGASCRTGGATPYPVESLDDLAWKLEILRSLPDSAGPIVAFLHLLAPHEPYLFAAGCSPRAPWWPATDQGADFDRIGDAYAIQVACLDHMLLRTVRALLQRPGPRPVIILQGDHGHGRITIDPFRGFTLSADELSPEQIGERLSVFAAYLFPGADTAVYDEISAVNVMPLVLRSLFGTEASRQPDRSLWSTYQHAFTFTEIDASLMRPPPGSLRRDGAHGQDHGSLSRTVR